MSAPNIKLWRREHDAIVSPRFPDAGTFSRVKKFFIRSRIHIESDDVNKIIRIITDEDKAHGNTKKLRMLGLI